MRGRARGETGRRTIDDGRRRVHRHACGEDQRLQRIEKATNLSLGCLFLSRFGALLLDNGLLPGVELPASLGCDPELGPTRAEGIDRERRMVPTGVGPSAEIWHRFTTWKLCQPE